ncbi:YoaK family protein [Salipiger sp. 1_MG-2023]|uniref:YoaK family protein n=1 Tax=Salipiger sp. 1_MG-2023 TaxID=3062665 RepID=UPI0026E45495|nr:YoaK family protein [Salipiger sp. 1_MG-2023]MDO6585548.1 YoaK family protein [Salipiger sp. 1_MG-2023]
MLIHDGQSRGVRFDLYLAVWLALAAGGVNAAGFRALGYFSANMTGNVSTLSEELALGRVGTALWALALVAGFILGAFAAGVLIEAGFQRGLRGVYALSILAEGLGLIALSLLGALWTSVAVLHLMLLGMSLLMGLQNAASTRISDGRVRTSHVSGIATDIGLELAALTGGRTGMAGDHRQVILRRLALHLATLVAFFAGGVLGVWGYERIGSLVFTAIGALLVLLAVPQLVTARRR